MYLNHADPQTYRTWLTQPRFEIAREGLLPEGTGGHTILLALRGYAS